MKNMNITLNIFLLAWLEMADGADSLKYILNPTPPHPAHIGTQTLHSC